MLCWLQYPKLALQAILAARLWRQPKTAHRLAFALSGSGSVGTQEQRSRSPATLTADRARGSPACFAAATLTKAAAPAASPDMHSLCKSATMGTTKDIATLLSAVMPSPGGADRRAAAAVKPLAGGSASRCATGGGVSLRTAVTASCLHSAAAEAAYLGGGGGVVYRGCGGGGGYSSCTCT